jgi:hypothetical protein
MLKENAMVKKSNSFKELKILCYFNNFCDQIILQVSYLYMEIKKWKIQCELEDTYLFTHIFLEMQPWMYHIQVYFQLETH